MQVRFETTAESFVANTLALQKYIHRAMGLTPRAQILWSLAFGLLVVAPLIVFGAFVLQQVSGMTERVIELAFLVLAVGALSGFCFWYRRRFVRRLADLNSPLFGPTEVLLREDALVVTGPKSRSEFAWDGVEELSLTDDALQIGFFGCAMVRIPRSAFSSEAELQDLMGEIEAHRRAGDRPPGPLGREAV